MPKIIVLVGPPGSGKSTLATDILLSGGEWDTGRRVSQDDQGKTGHMETFELALEHKRNIVVDRMGFSKEQRSRYLNKAREYGYETQIVVLHESYDTCFKRAVARQGHPTIKDEKNARHALDLFFTKYERVEDNEADTVTRIWPHNEKPSAIICDLDGTLCDCEHRRHFVNPDIKPEGFKKNWKAFFDGISGDSLNPVCYDILKGMSQLGHTIVYASGRDDGHRQVSIEWLEKNSCTEFNSFRKGGFQLYMRHRKDSRPDYVVKEIILDFEILTRFTPYFMLDDRDQVVQMWRKRGFTCLQVANGDF